MNIEENKYLIKKIFNKNFPLIWVFWFGFVFLAILIEIVLQAGFLYNIYIEGFILIYSIVIFLTIFKSANNYEGNKIWSFLAKIIITIYLFFSVSIFIDMYKYNFLEDYYLEKDIKEFQKELPIQVDLNSTLIDIYKDDKTIFYKYNLLGVDLSLEKNKNLLKKQVQESICDDENTLELMKKDYIFEYTYLNENEEEILKVKTIKEDCGNAIYDLEILTDVLQKQNLN